MFTDEECGNLKVVADGGKLTIHIDQKKSQTVYKPMDVHSVTNAVGESISSISK